MRLYDQHLHTKYSMDSEALPDDNVRAAIEQGLAGLTFTDHFDTHPTEWHTTVYDYTALADDIARLRTQFGQQIFIGHGIEICYQPGQMDRILAFLNAHNFDLVILSVHWFDGKALHERSHWDGLDTATATRSYLECVLGAARCARDLAAKGQRPFDVLGHLDLVKRYTKRYYQSFDIRPYADLVDEILRTCLESGLVPEVNLSSLRQGVAESMPAPWVVRRYAELGGEAMTLGSDAHQVEHVGYGLPDGMKLLKSAGIKKLAVFKGRDRQDEVL